MEDIIGWSLVAIYVYLLLFQLDKLPMIVACAFIGTIILVFANGILRSEIGPFVLGALVIWSIYTVAKGKKPK